MIEVSQSNFIKKTFTRRKVLNLYIFYEIRLWLYDLGAEFTIVNCLFAAAKLTKYVVVDKYGYSGYGREFDARSSFSLRNHINFGKNVIVFGVDNS